MGMSSFNPLRMGELIPTGFTTPVQFGEGWKSFNPLRMGELIPTGISRLALNSGDTMFQSPSHGGTNSYSGKEVPRGSYALVSIPFAWGN